MRVCDGIGEGEGPLEGRRANDYDLRVAVSPPDLSLKFVISATTSPSLSLFVDTEFDFSDEQPVQELAVTKPMMAVTKPMMAVTKPMMAATKPITHRVSLPATIMGMP